MRGAPPLHVPHEQKKVLARAARLAWVTLLATGISTVLLYLVKGRSMAMQAAWLESLVSLLPPLAFLASSRLVGRAATGRFPYGFHRATSVGYLVGSLALLGMGTFIVYSSALPLLRTEYPAIGTVPVLGSPVWLGWLMLPVLAYDLIVMHLLGRKMLSLAEPLHDKQLYAVAEMNRADWLSDGAAMLGVVGIGFGLWWADALAALVIGVDVWKDGLKNTGRAFADLMDATPTTPGQKQVDPLVDRIAEYLRQLEWVQEASIRVRDEGHAFFGEAYVVPRAGTTDLIAKLEAAAGAVTAMDWKMLEFVIAPVRSIPHHLEVEDPPLAAYEYRRERQEGRERRWRRLRQRLHTGRRRLQHRS